MFWLLQSGQMSAGELGMVIKSSCQSQLPNPGVAVRGTGYWLLATDKFPLYYLVNQNIFGLDLA